jgi:hypothetical protein
VGALSVQRSEHTGGLPRASATPVPARGLPPVMPGCRAKAEREGEREQNLQSEPPTLVADLSAKALGLKDSEVGLVQRPCRAAFAPFS